MFKIVYISMVKSNSDLAKSKWREGGGGGNGVRSTLLKILEIEFTKNPGELLLLFQAGLFSKEEI